MKKYYLNIFLISLIIITNPCFAEDNIPLFLNSNQSYILSFDDEIQEVQSDQSILKTEVLNSIFNDKQQMVVTYTGNKPAKLNVTTTSGNKYNYDVQFSSENKDNENVLDLDQPPFIPQKTDDNDEPDLPPSAKEK